jgi:asparaginyl-tRNA synthetase
MMEPEMICDSLDELLHLTESQIHYCVDYVLDHCEEEIAFLQQTHSPKLITHMMTMRRKFARITYTDAIKALQEAKDVGFEAPEWGDDLSSDMEKYLVQTLDAVVIVTHYPKSLKSFYMKDSEDCKDQPTVECMDILVPGVGELVGGSMREDDYDVLIGKMKEKGMDLKLYEWYTDLRKWGSMPHGGYGMGFERFLMAMTGLQVKDLIPFYRSYTQMSM